MTTKKISFEKAMKQLEDIVSELEAGDPPLEKALQKFEEGMKLSKICSKKLEEIENKITILLQKESGEVTEKQWHPDEANTPS